MSDIATLGFRAESDELVVAKERLDKISPAAETAEKAAGKLTNQFSGLGKITSGLGNILSGAKSALLGIAAGMAAAFSVQGIISGLTAISQSIDDVSKAATKLDANMGDLQALGLAADLAGQDFNALAMSAQKMNKVLATAIATGKGTDGVFKILGVSAKALADMPITDRFAFLADKLKSLNLTAEQSALVLAKLGDRSGSLFALLDGGSAGIKEASNLLDEFNGKLTNEQGQQVEAMNDAWTKLTYSIKAAGIQIVAFTASFNESVFSDIASVIGAITRGVIWLGSSTSSAAASMRTALLSIIPIFGPIMNALDAFGNLFKTLFGVTVKQAAINGANALVNVWKGAFTGIGIIWDHFPEVIASAAIGAVNYAIKEINRLTVGSVNALNTLASAVSGLFGGKMGDLMDANKVKIPTIDNPFAHSSMKAFEDAKAAFDAQMKVNNFPDFNDSITNLTSNLKPATKGVVDIDGALNNTAKSAGAAAEKLTELQRIGKELDGIGAPFDQAKQDFDKVTELQKNGIITGDQYTSMLGRIQTAFMAAGGTATQWSKIISTKTNEMADAMKDFATNALTQVGDSFIQLALTGKASFKDLVNSVVTDLLRMMWQMLVVKPLINSLFGGGLSVLGLGGTVAGSGVATAAAGGANAVTSLPITAANTSNDVRQAANASIGRQIASAPNSNVTFHNTVNLQMPPSSGDPQKDKQYADNASEVMKKQLSDFVDERIASATQYGGTLNARGFG